MVVCLKCGKEFEHRRHLFRHLRQVHQDTDGGNPKDSAPSGENSRKRRRTEDHTLPGDYWPTEKQLVITTGGPGDLIPWSQQHNLMLLAPSAVCGVMVPRGWSPATACGVLGVNRETLRGTRRSAGPILSALLEELKEACRQSCHQPDEDGKAA